MSAKDMSAIFNGLLHVNSCIVGLIAAPIVTLQDAWMVGELRAATGHGWKAGTFGEASSSFFIDHLSPQAADKLAKKFNDALGAESFESVGPFKRGAFSFGRGDFKQVRLYERKIKDELGLLDSLRMDVV